MNAIYKVRAKAPCKLRSINNRDRFNKTRLNGTYSLNSSELRAALRGVHLNALNTPTIDNFSIHDVLERVKTISI